MAADLGIIISGRAGQGMQVVSQVLGRVLVRSGRHVLATQDVMSRIRGGHNFSRIRVSSGPALAECDRAQILLALDKELVRPHLEELDRTAIVIVDDEDGSCIASEHRVVCIPLRRLAAEHGEAVMQNSVALGAVTALFDKAGDLLPPVLAETFRLKGDAAVQGNVACAAAGRDYVRRQAPDVRITLPEPTAGQRLFLTGSQALGLGAIAAGVRFVAGYPMSPATPILEYLAAHVEDAGMVVELVEDEIAAINAIQGAAFAGVRAMTATAGGGFSLMCEGLSLAGMTETGIVVMLGMRPGPATGLATRTAQADLLFALSAGHGEFPRAVLAPADAGQAVALARRAFAIAAAYQTPAIVLFDQFLGDASWTMPRPETPAVPAADSPPAEPFSYRRYALTDSGVSPFVRPGTAGQLVYADSDEHTEEGHITESAETRTLMAQKRLRKEAGIAGMMPAPDVLHPDAGTLACCFGSTRGIVLEAVTRLHEAGHDVGMVHLSGLWPFPAAALAGIAQNRRLLTVEQNCTGQLARLIRQETGLKVRTGIRRYDGRQLRVAEVEQGLAELLT